MSARLRKGIHCKWKNYDEIYRSTWEPRAHLAEGKTRAQTKLLDDYEKRHNLVALSSEGEAESVASRLLDQSKTGKEKDRKEHLDPYRSLGISLI